jgi:molybdopterin converting factor small subunit
MQLNILTFGIARDIVGGNSFEMTIPEGTDVAGLKSLLMQKYPEFKKLASFAIAVDEAYRDDVFVLEAASEVVIIPPVSGG